ncbi:hypothetical protein [Azospirillum halopraeferens]|uniref:hypothetical protein n=1 Tax=Azospirillum halopraeferens TaxID=34010 RepID=UPI000A079B6A|nr:hypothetical protein [Azospirillum halopraeferens]
MARAHYFVTKRSNGWFILLERERYGPFSGGREAALIAAVQAAHQAGKDGHEASVRLRAVDGRVRIAWTFGSDPYPPAWTESLRLKASVIRRRAPARAPSPIEPQPV